MYRGHKVRERSSVICKFIKNYGAKSAGTGDQSAMTRVCNYLITQPEYAFSPISVLSITNAQSTFSDFKPVYRASGLKEFRHERS